jgi:hypothetical protein
MQEQQQVQRSYCLQQQVRMGAQSVELQALQVKRQSLVSADGTAGEQLKLQ